MTATLRELAQAATPGWEVHRLPSMWVPIDPRQRAADLAYLNACSPDAILALLDQLDAAQEALLDVWHNGRKASDASVAIVDAIQAARALQEEP